jgi:hypothetical protein
MITPLSWLPVFKYKYKKLKLNSFILPCILLTTMTLTNCSCKKNNPNTEPVLITEEPNKQFSSAWHSYLLSNKGGWQDNEKGRLSWDDGYALDGLIAFYKATQQKQCLDTFAIVGNRIMQLDDNTLKRVDPYRNNLSLHGWSSPRYTHDSTRHIFGVTDAMILSPCVAFYNLVKDNPTLSAYKPIGKKYLDKAILEFNEVQKKDWKEIDANKGYFQDPYQTGRNINTPLNQFCRVGVLAIELYKATGDMAYLAYSQKLATYLKERFIKKDDYFYWKYWEITNTSQADLVDDLSHAMLVVQFITSCYENNIAFQKTDIDQLVNLFLKKIMTPNKDNFNLYIDGTGGITKDVYISYYLLLSPYSKDVYTAIANWYQNQSIVLDNTSSFNHFGERIVLTQGLLSQYR